MEKYVELILEYKNIYPIIFWGLLTVISFISILLIKKLKNRTHDVNANQNDNTINKASKKQNQTARKKKENYKKTEKQIKVEEPVTEYTQQETESPSVLEDLSDTVETEPFVSLNSKPKKRNDKLPEAESDKNKNLNKRLFVEYIPPQSFSQVEPWQYPVIKFPKKKCIIRSHR